MQIYCGKCRALVDLKHTRLVKDQYVCDECRGKK